MIIKELKNSFKKDLIDRELITIFEYVQFLNLKIMKATPKEINHMLKNKMTEVLVNWVGSQKQITKVLISPQFFHPTHNKKDRELIVYHLEGLLKCKIHRTGEDMVKIEF